LGHAPNCVQDQPIQFGKKLPAQNRVTCKNLGFAVQIAGRFTTLNTKSNKAKSSASGILAAPPLVGNGKLELKNSDKTLAAVQNPLDRCGFEQLTTGFVGKAH
jgi:hypothetical protein